MFNCLVVTSNSFGGISDLIKNENFGYVYNLYDSKQLSFKMIKSMSKMKNNLNKIKNARKNLNSIYSKNNLLINFLQKIINMRIAIIPGIFFPEPGIAQIQTHNLANKLVEKWSTR